MSDICPVREATSRALHPQPVMVTSVLAEEPLVTPQQRSGDARSVVETNIVRIPPRSSCRRPWCWGWCGRRQRRRCRCNDAITIDRSVAQACLFPRFLTLSLVSLGLIVPHEHLDHRRHLRRRQGSGTSLQKWTGTAASCERPTRRPLRASRRRP